MKLTDAIKKLFKRKHTTPLPTGERLRVGDGTSGMGHGERFPLRIEGVKPAPLTAEPDDAELAAQALLDSLASEELRVKSEAFELCSLATEGTQEFATAQHDSTAQPRQPIPADAPTRSLSAISHHTSEYYHALADRIRTARTAEARLVMRLLASVEERLRVGEQSSRMQLEEPTALYKGQWGDTERKLYRAMDVAEREGGELKSRWQHCLANVLVRRMEESPADNTDPSDQDGDPTDPNE